MTYRALLLTVLAFGLGSEGMAQSVLRGGNALNGGAGSASRFSVPQSSVETVQQRPTVEQHRSNNRRKQADAQRKLNALREELARRPAPTAPRSGPATAGAVLPDAQGALAALARSLGLSDEDSETMMRILDEGRDHGLSDQDAAVASRSLDALAEMRLRAAQRVAGFGLIAGDVHRVQWGGTWSRGNVQKDAPLSDGEKLFRQLERPVQTQTPYELTRAQVAKLAPPVVAMQENVNAAEQRRMALQAEARAMFSAHAAHAATDEPDQQGLLDAAVATLDAGATLADAVPHTSADAEDPSRAISQSLASTDTDGGFSIAKLLQRLK